MRIYAAILLLVILLPSQYRAQVTHASISQNVITIGERVTLSYSLPVKFTESVLFNPSEKFIPSKRSNEAGKIENAPLETVEILIPFKDTIIEAEGGPMWTGYYEITVWDSGTFVLPGPVIALGKEKLQFPSVSFTVKLSPAIKGIDTYDIKESFAKLPEETWKEKLSSFFATYGWTGLMLIIAFVAWLFFRKRSHRKKDQKELSLYDQTLNRLQELEQHEWWRKGKIKSHYSELSLLLKNYLSSVYQLQLLERTTAETLLLISQKIESNEHTNSLKQLLESSDLVKFAKYHPEVNQILAHLRQSKELITAIHENSTPTDEQ
jgi:hypothetical protein